MQHAAYFGNSAIRLTRRTPTLVTVERHCAATTLDRFLRNPELYGLLGSEHEGLTACVPQSAGDAGVQCPRPAFIIM